MYGTYDITNQYSGDTFNSIQFTCDLNDTAIDLTSVDIFMQVRDVNNNLVLDLSVGSGITKVDAVNGVFRVGGFEIPTIVGNHTYDIQFNYSSGVIRTYIRGKFIIVSEITVI